MRHVVGGRGLGAVAKPASTQKPRQCRITTGDLIGAGDADRVDRGGGSDSCEKITGEIKKGHVAEAFIAFRGCIWRRRGQGGIAGQTRQGPPIAISRLRKWRYVRHGGAASLPTGAVRSPRVSSKWACSRLSARWPRNSSKRPTSLIARMRSV